MWRGMNCLCSGGGKSLLESGKIRVVYFEVSSRLARKAGFSPAEAPSFLSNLGYHLYKLVPAGKLVEVNPKDAKNNNIENWVAIRSDDKDRYHSWKKENRRE